MATEQRKNGFPYEASDFDLDGIATRPVLARERMLSLPVKFISLEENHLEELLEWLIAKPDIREDVLGERHVDTLSWKAYDSYRYIAAVLDWSSDEETRAHLDPKPPRWLPHKPISARTAVSRMTRHYLNQRDDTPERFYNTDIEYFPSDIETCVALHPNTKQPVAIGTVRLSRDPYVDLQVYDACIETIVVNPNFRGLNIGSQMVGHLTEEAIRKGKKRIYTWVLAPTHGDLLWQRQFSLFQRRGFDLAEEKDDREVSASIHWVRHCEIRGIPVDREEDALFLKTTPERYRPPSVPWWEERVKEYNNYER